MLLFSQIEGQLERLYERRASDRADLERALAGAQRAGRKNATREEQRALENLRNLDARISDLEGQVERGDISELSRRVNAAPTTGNTVQSSRLEPRQLNHLTYRENDRHTSWIRDLVRTSVPGMDPTGESRSRLAQHAREVASDPVYASMGVEFRDISRVDGQGGYAVPPAWLVNQYVELARPGRAFANAVQRQPLPGGTDSINIPKLLTGTAVAIQTADNATIADVDLTDTYVTAPVRTIAGQEGVAIQLIDQSPIAFDDVVFRDLVAAHAAATDTQLLDGSGTNGQVLGLAYTPGIATIAASSVTVAGIYSAIANAIQQIHTSRFLPPEAVFMHPRRWGWLLSLLDTTDRPLFLPAANGLFNAAGVLEDVASQQVVGQIQGLPIITDPNITITAGTEYSSYGDEDIIIIGRVSDAVLWESGIRARVLPETKASNLTVLLQVYSYLAATFARFPQSFAVITGLSAPTF